MNTDRHVIGVFDNRTKAQHAIDTLMKRDFDPECLSLLVSEDGRNSHFEVNKDKSKTAEGVGYGAVLGGLAAGLGAAAAGLVSISVPGAIFVAGPLAAALATGAAGAAVGGLAGGLIGVGIPEDEVSVVESDLKDGSILVAAHSMSNDREKITKEVFKSAGAVRIH